MGIITWLNTNSGAVIGIAIVILAGVIGYYVYLTWRLLKAGNTPEIAISLAGGNPRLSHVEFEAALEEWDALVKKFAKPDDQPLSDYAMSRESIYENHPKL